jgi:hypothetical protein
VVSPRTTLKWRAISTASSRTSPQTTQPRGGCWSGVTRGRRVARLSLSGQGSQGRHDAGQPARARYQGRLICQMVG